SEYLFAFRRSQNIIKAGKRVFKFFQPLAFLGRRKPFVRFTQARRHDKLTREKEEKANRNKCQSAEHDHENGGKIALRTQQKTCAYADPDGKQHCEHRTDKKAQTIIVAIGNKRRTARFLPRADLLAKRL